MRKVKGLTVFGIGRIDLTPYDKIEEFPLEYEDSISLIINFEQNGKVVRRMYNPQCDVEYAD